MLDAGMEVFAGLSLDDILAQLGPRRVVRQLGDVSVGAFYHHFPNQADFIRALVDHGLDADAQEVVGEMVTQILEVAHGAAPQVLEQIGRASRLDFERRASVGLPAQRLRLCVWLAADDPGMRRLLRERYERSTAQYVAAYELVLTRWGREFRPPFTARSAAAVLTAVLEGLVIRHRVDPETAGPELYAHAVTALFPTLTRPIGEHETLDQAVAHMSRFRSGPSRPPAGPEDRRRLLDSVLARADAGSYGESSVEDIAAEAGVSATAVYEEFRGKPGLSAATFARFLPMLERPIEADLADGTNPVEVIRRHLGRLADVAARHRGLTNALLDAVQGATIRYGSHIGPNDPRAAVPLPQLVVPAIEAGQEQGVVRSDFDAFELAAVTTNLMLLRVMTRPEEDPADAAALVSEIALEGLSVRR